MKRAGRPGDDREARPRRARAAPRLVPAVLGFLSLATAGCVSDGTDYEAAPFYVEDRAGPKGTVTRTIPIVLSAVDQVPASRKLERQQGAKQTRVVLLWPFVKYWSEGDEHDLGFSGIGGMGAGLLSAGPLGRSLASGIGGPFVQPSFLFPDAEVGGTALFPLIAYDRLHVDPRHPTETKRDFGLVPLFAGGDWPGKGKYFVLAPFGGYTHGILGKQDALWVGFPYPFYLSWRDTSYESRHVLWPLVNWVSGERHSGFRVLPFYAHYEKTDLLGNKTYDRTWVMWPLLTWQKNSTGETVVDEDGERRAAPTDIFFAFPFYGRVRGPDYSTTSVLWPFFRWETIPSGRYWELRAPFPFVMVHHGKDPERLRADFWPIGGWRERPGYIRHFFFWPIERYENRDDKYASDLKFYFLPLVAYHWHLEKRTQEEHSRLHVWPFMTYRRGARGDVYVHALAPILWEDPDGFERLFFPFLRLYEYRRNTIGGTSHRFLLGLASIRSEPATPEREEYDRLSFLFGLFQYRNRGGAKALSLFWIPELIEWGKQ